LFTVVSRYVVPRILPERNPPIDRRARLSPNPLESRGMQTAAATPGPVAARLLPQRLFYGWYVAIACGVLMFVGVGVGYYGLPIFLKPLKDEHGWSTTAVSWAPAIYFCVAGVTSFLIGPIIDRRGPMLFMTSGMIVNGISGAAIGLVSELWQLYTVYFIFAVAYGLSSGVAVNAIMTRWFIRKRALAMSVSSTGVSLGGVVIAPIASWLINIGGLELATPILGALVIIAGLPVILWVIEWEPTRMGLTPDGITTAQTHAGPRQLSLDTQLRPWTRREAMHTVSFWALMIAFLLVLIAQTGYIIHQVTFLEDRLGSRSEAAFTISVTAIGSIVARLAVGIFADGVDRRLLCVVLFVVQATCVLIIVHTENLAATWILTLIFGFTIGNIYMMQSLLVGEIFGMVSFGTIFGFITMAGQVGSSVGPIGVGFLHDQSGDYVLPFTLTAAVTYVAAVIVLFAKPAPAQRVEAAEESEPRPTTVPAVGGR
jgi:sugar phosphate permease